MTRLKILHLITRLILGGAQENTVLSCEGQHEQGHEVTLAFGPIYGPEGSLLERAKKGGYKIVELSEMKREVDLRGDRRCYKQCRALIRELGPDVVHTHSSKAGVLGRFAAWAEKAPAVVHTIHGLPFHPYQSKLKNCFYVMSERMAAKRCHAIVSVADAMTRQALESKVGKLGQYRTIYSGMEVDLYLHDPAPGSRAATRKQLGFGENDFVVGTVARLAELKGHDDLLSVLPELVKAHPNVKYLWVGDGWWRERLEMRLVEMGLKDRVKIVGLVPADEIARYMRGMDLLVHPSYREGLPRSVPQALLCGTAVAAYDCDGAAEACLDMQTGLLVGTGDVKRLGKAIAWMIEHPQERAKMTQVGRELCRQRFDHRKMVSKLEELYRQLLRDRD